MFPLTMSFTEKIDVLELLIELLMEHEKRMDDLVHSLEHLVEQIEGEVSAPVLVGDPSNVDAKLEDMR